MTWESTLLKLMRFILQAMALVLGSGSILALWISFYIPDCGALALVMLFTAGFITLGLPQPPAAAGRRGRPAAGWQTRTTLAMRLRRWRDVVRLRLSRLR
jgi:hypothetical protein